MCLTPVFHVVSCYGQYNARISNSGHKTQHRNTALTSLERTRYTAVSISNLAQFTTSSTHRNMLSQNIWKNCGVAASGTPWFTSRVGTVQLSDQLNFSILDVIQNVFPFVWRSLFESRNYGTDTRSAVFVDIRCGSDNSKERFCNLDLPYDCCRFILRPFIDDDKVVHFPTHRIVVYFRHNVVAAGFLSIGKPNVAWLLQCEQSRSIFLDVFPT